MIGLLILRLVNLQANLENCFEASNKEAVVALIQEGDTMGAVDQLLEESKDKNLNVFKYLSIQSIPLF